MIKLSTSRIKHLIIIAALTLVILVDGIAYHRAFSKTQVMQMPEATTILFPNDSYSYFIHDAEMLPGGLGGLYAPTGNDPQIVFSLDEPIEINSLRITLKQPAKADTVVELYYAGQEKTFSEERCLRIVLPESSQEQIVDLPAGTCHALRIDINGTVAIDAIKISEAPLEPAFPEIIRLASLFLTILLVAAALLCFLLVRYLQVPKLPSHGQGEGSDLFWQKTFILALFFIGIVLRFMVMAFGHNYDFDSYCIVGEISGNLRNVYAETSRYNYGPVFFVFQGLLYRLSQIAGDNWMNLYRVLIVSLLVFADLGIAVFIAYRYSITKALLFFLNPVSIIISGYHNQFDNIAILFALLSILYFNDDPKWNRRDIGFVVFFTLSLMTKHILFLVPVILLFTSRLSMKKKALYAFVPPMLFLLSFVPFVVGNPAAFQGMKDNVFLYRSLNNSPLLHALYDRIGLPSGMSFFVYIACMISVAFAVRKQDYDAALFIYLIAMLTFSSAIANQYLAIPMAALFVLGSGGWKYIYIAVSTFFLLINGNGLHLSIQLPEGVYTQLQGYIAANGYSIAAWLLLITLIHLVVLCKTKGSAFGRADHHTFVGQECL